MIDTIKVKDLIRLLRKFDGELPVFHQTDPEGNSFGTIKNDSVYHSQVNRDGVGNGHAVFIAPYEENLDDNELFGDL